MDLLFHWFLPLLILAFFERRIRTSTLLLSIFTIVPDLDILFLPAKHRYLMNNVFFLMIPLIIGIFFYFKNNKKVARVFFIISFFLFSHIMLDLTYGGEPLFYPVSNKFVEVSLELQTYGNLQPKWHNYIRFYNPQESVDWRSVSDNPDVKPGIIAWRNSFIVIFLFVILLLVNIKHLKDLFEDDLGIIKRRTISNTKT